MRVEGKGGGGGWRGRVEEEGGGGGWRGRGRVEGVVSGWRRREIFSGKFMYMILYVMCALVCLWEKGREGGGGGGGRDTK